MHAGLLGAEFVHQFGAESRACQWRGCRMGWQTATMRPVADDWQSCLPMFIFDISPSTSERLLFKASKADSGILSIVYLGNRFPRYTSSDVCFDRISNTEMPARNWIFGVNVSKKVLEKASSRFSSSSQLGNTSSLSLISFEL